MRIEEGTFGFAKLAKKTSDQDSKHPTATLCISCKEDRTYGRQPADDRRPKSLGTELPESNLLRTGHGCPILIDASLDDHWRGFRGCARLNGRRRGDHLSSNVYLSHWCFVKPPFFLFSPWRSVLCSPGIFNAKKTYIELSLVWRHFRCSLLIFRSIKRTAGLDGLFSFILVTVGGLIWAWKIQGVKKRKQDGSQRLEIFFSSESVSWQFGFGNRNRDDGSGGVLMTPFMSGYWECLLEVPSQQVCFIDCYYRCAWVQHDQIAKFLSRVDGCDDRWCVCRCDDHSKNIKWNEG